MLGSIICRYLVYLACLNLPGYGILHKAENQKPDTSQNTMDTLFRLDQHSREVLQPVTATMLLGHTYRFIQVDVIKVVNPKQHPLMFYVYYQPLGRKQELLGSFGLYPADNPGKFIVATHGKIIGKGTVVIRLVSPDKIPATDSVAVTIKKLKFREQ